MKTMNINFKEWKRLNESRMMEVNGEIVIAAPARTDWFNNPVPEDGGVRLYSDVSLEKKTVRNLRAGV